MLLVFIPILHMGGIWKSFRYLMATPSAAYANYRKADTETVLTFEGRWRHTREHVRGEGVILDARPALFWIIRTRPPVHYLELRRMEQELEEKKQEIEALKRAQVRFSGTLYIRILGDM